MLRLMHLAMGNARLAGIRDPTANYNRSVDNVKQIAFSIGISSSSSYKKGKKSRKDRVLVDRLPAIKKDMFNSTIFNLCAKLTIIHDRSKDKARLDVLSSKEA